MEKILNRLFFYPADLRMISGKSERTCARIFKKIQEYFNIANHQAVTVHHASKYLGITPEELRQHLK